MKLVKWFVIILVVLILGAGGLLYYTLNTHVDISKYDKWTVKGVNETNVGSVYVRYAGISTMTISDGKTTLLIDGFFSRPSEIEVLTGTVKTDLDAVTFGLEKLKVNKLDAVMTVHSHYDHAMDTPEVAKRTGAVMIGSESTANIGRGWGLPEKQIRVINDGEPMAFGDFTVTAMKSNHFEFPESYLARRIARGPINITQPVKQPIKAFDYRMGGHYSYVIQHPKGTLLVQGSAGFVKDSLKNVKASVVMAGIGGLGSQTKEYIQTYFKEVVDTVGAKRVFAVHGDDLAGPLDLPFRGSSILADTLLGATIESFDAFEREMKNRPSSTYGQLPRWDAVLLFE